MIPAGMQSRYRGGGSCGAEAVRPGRGTAGVLAAVAAGSSRRTWTQRRRLPGRKAQRGPDMGECRGQRPRGFVTRPLVLFRISVIISLLLPTEAGSPAP